MTIWQPIETAPKKGEVDLFDAVRGIRAPNCFWHKARQKWVSVWNDRHGFSALRLPFNPTHWAPLPDSPNER